MKFHFSYFKNFFGGPTSTFYPHKVPFLTVVSFSGFGKAEVKSIPRVLKTGCPDRRPFLKKEKINKIKVQAKGGTAAEML